MKNAPSKIVSVIAGLIAIFMMGMGIKILVTARDTGNYICGGFIVLVSLSLAATVYRIDRIMGTWNGDREPSIKTDASESVKVAPSEKEKLKKTPQVWAVWQRDGGIDIQYTCLFLPISKVHSVSFILETLVDDGESSVRITSVQTDKRPLMLKIGDERRAFNHKFTVVESLEEVAKVKEKWGKGEIYGRTVYQS